MASATLASHDGEEVLFEGRAALVPSVGTLLLAILTLGLWLLVRWFQTMGQHLPHHDAAHRRGDRRAVEEAGADRPVSRGGLHGRAPFGQRIMGTGNLLLKTFDKTTPELNVLAIKTDVVKLYESVRAATEADKPRRGVRMVDYETGTALTRFDLHALVRRRIGRQERVDDRRRRREVRDRATTPDPGPT